jgi:hypothetical protein
LKLCVKYYFLNVKYGKVIIFLTNSRIHHCKLFSLESLNCSSRSSKETLDSNSPDLLLTQFSSLLPPAKVVIPKTDISLTEMSKLPNIGNWTSHQIANYFQQVGFPFGLCNAFIDQVKFSGFLNFKVVDG